MLALQRAIDLGWNLTICLDGVTPTFSIDILSFVHPKDWVRVKERVPRIDEVPLPVTNRFHPVVALDNCQ